MKQHKRRAWSDREVKVLESLVNKGLSWKDLAMKLNSACNTSRTEKACKNKAQALWELIHTNSVMLFTKEDEKKTAEFLRRTLSVRKPEGPSMCLWTAIELALLSELKSEPNMTWDMRAETFNTIMGTSRTGKALKERAAKERAATMQAPVGIAHVDDAGAVEVCESGSGDWCKPLPVQEVERQAMAFTVSAFYEACDGSFNDLLVDVVPLPDTTWNPYQAPC